MEDTDKEDLKEKYKRFRKIKEMTKDGRNYTPRYRDFDEEEYSVETFQSVIRRVGKDKLEENIQSVRKIPLTCLNCGYRALFFSFLNEKKTVTGTIRFKGDHYDKEFYCPKCKSTYVGYRDDDVKEIAIDLL